MSNKATRLTFIVKQIFTIYIGFPPHAPRRHCVPLLKLAPVFYCRADSLSCAMTSSFLYISCFAFLCPPLFLCRLTSWRLFKLPSYKQLHKSFWSCAVRALVTHELLTLILKCSLIPTCTFFPMMLLSTSPSSFYILGVVYFSSYFT